MAKRQERLPGTGDAKDERLEELVGEYHSTNLERIALQRTEKAKHDALLFYMDEKGIKVVNIDDLDPPLTVKIKESTRKVSVREQDASDADDGDEDPADGDIDFDDAVLDEASAAAAEVERLTTKKAKAAAKPKKPKAKKG
jgi:hypothetical protein